jgi:hypothetical protein
MGNLPGRSLVVKPHTLSWGIAYRAPVEFSRMRCILHTEYPTTRPGMSVIGTAIISHQKKSTLAGADSQNMKNNPVRTPKNVEIGRKKSPMTSQVYPSTLSFALLLPNTFGQKNQTR